MKVMKLVRIENSSGKPKTRVIILDNDVGLGGGPPGRGEAANDENYDNKDKGNAKLLSFMIRRG